MELYWSYTKNAYEYGLNYNQTINTLEQQQKLGWHVNFTVNNMLAELYLTDKDNKPLKDAQIQLFAKNTASDKYDFFVPLIYINDSYYKNVLNFPKAGQWNISVAILRFKSCFAIW